MLQKLLQRNDSRQDESDFADDQSPAKIQESVKLFPFFDNFSGKTYFNEIKKRAPMASGKSKAAFNLNNKRSGRRNFFPFLPFPRAAK